ncbi:PepSY-associated TM helix domain-containing protein [Methylophaga sp. OBS4]|uniref:PepSY-associated TM helix domain-containing protein n=1 Tax=Methylophaga sp. OBS4 TaxID=2991935 RepID=UPI00225B8327|nr:PepSY-associated TM helix domain-containing protein [Methylophaga sp. OBS4]MCX4187976.1 PepSY domain-containing protein [Methylophaga sp. OBS4]
MRRRRFWMQLHRWIGVFILLFVVIAGLTGSAIAFWRTVDSWFNPAWYNVVDSGTPKSFAKLSRAVLEKYPGSSVHGFILPRNERSSVIIYLAGESTGIDEVFLNPYSGEVLGDRDTDRISLGRQHLLPFLYRLHYSLAAGGIGETFLGIVALLWLLMTMAGIWLAWPKPGKWRKALSIKSSAGMPRLMFDLHRAGGLLFAVVFLIIIWTGLWWNMDYAVRPVVSSLLPTTSWFPDTLPEVADKAAEDPDKAIARALAVRPDAEAYYLRIVPDKALYTVYLRQPGEAAPYGRTFVFVSFDGTVLDIDEPAKNLAGDSYAEWQLPLHTGQFLGLPGRLFWCLAGLVPLMLGITGLALWLRKSR